MQRSVSLYEICVCEHTFSLICLIEKVVLENNETPFLKPKRSIEIGILSFSDDADVTLFVGGVFAFIDCIYGLAFNNRPVCWRY